MENVAPLRPTPGTGCAVHVLVRLGAGDSLHSLEYGSLQLAGGSPGFTRRGHADHADAEMMDPAPGGAGHIVQPRRSLEQAGDSAYGHA